MMLSQNAAEVLVDLIENKLAVMSVDDRDDLRDMIALQRCLAELKGLNLSEMGGIPKAYAGKEISRRGRHPKIASFMPNSCQGEVSSARG